MNSVVTILAGPTALGKPVTPFTKSCRPGTCYSIGFQPDEM